MKMTSISARACHDAAWIAGSLGGVFLMGLLLAGCRSSSPYEGHRSWVVCQSATPPYAADYDLLYFYPRLLDWHAHANATNIFLMVEARLKPFGFTREARVRDYRLPRLFAPYVSPAATAADVREAIRRYLETSHEPGRLYAIVAEGESVPAVREVVAKGRGWFGDLDREDGYFAAFFAPEGRALDMEELSVFLKRLVKSARLTHDWRRPVPADVAGISEGTLEAWHERED